MKKSLFALLCATWCLGVHAADVYPSRPVRVIVPFQAGSAADIYSRYLARGMGEILKTPFVVENRVGASGLIGASMLAKAAPDGYTIGYLGIQNMSAHYLMKSASFDMTKDIQPIQLAGILTQVVVVAKDNPAKTLSEFIQNAKAKNTEVSFGSGGVGSPAHLAAQALASAAGLRTMHIPYKGSPESISGLVGGQIDYLVTTASTAVPLVKAGQLRALAVTSPKRSDQLPDTPTTMEALPHGFVYQGWGIFAAPTGTPKPIIDKLSDTMLAVMKQPQTIQFFDQNGSSADTLALSDLVKFLQSEDQRTRQYIKAAGLKAE